MAWIGARQDGRARFQNNLSDPVGDTMGFGIIAIFLFVHKLSLGEHRNVLPEKSHRGHILLF